MNLTVRQGDTVQMVDEMLFYSYLKGSSSPAGWYTFLICMLMHPLYVRNLLALNMDASGNWLSHESPDLCKAIIRSCQICELI